MDKSSKIVLSIGAHPDDIEIGCGGAEISLRKKGYSLVHIIVTNGEEGGLESSENLSQKRRAEAIESGEIIGVQEIIFLNAPDGLTHFTKELKLELVKLIRKFRPQILFTHARQDHFTDHAVVHKLSLSAIEAAGGPWYPGAAGESFSVKNVFGYEVWNPLNHYQLSLDISEVMEQKRAALERHRSQTAHIPYLAAIEGLSRYRGAMTLTGKYAEVFEVMRAESIL